MADDLLDDWDDEVVREYGASVGIDVDDVEEVRSSLRAAAVRRQPPVEVAALNEWNSASAAVDGAVADRIAADIRRYR